MKLEDVARCAAVSTATASRVLRNPNSVKSTTRARVMEAIETLKYNPNSDARSLATGTSRTIGVIVSNLENPFFLDLYKAINRRAHAAGFEVIVANTGGNSGTLADSIRLMLGRRVAGVAAIVTGMEPQFMQELVGHQIPVVFYNSGTPRENTLIIRVNYRHSLEIVFSYLCGLGHRRIGCLGHHTLLDQIKECTRGKTNSIPSGLNLHLTMVEVEDSPEDGRIAARALLKADSSLTAIVCGSDWLAMGALRGLREGGVRVPADVSVTGFDDVTLAKFCNPPLTSAHIPRDRIGQIVCDFLIGPQPRHSRECSIDPEVVVRDSTGPNKFRLVQ